MELLVHVSAASSTKDDKHYQKQAKQYLAFESRNDVSLHESKAVGLEIEDEQKGTTVHARLIESSLPVAPGASLYLEDSLLARTALESQIVTSSLNGLGCSVSQYESTREEVSPDVSRPRHNSAPLLTSPATVLRAHADGTTETSPQSTRSVQRLASPYVPIQEGSGLAIGFVGSSTSPSKTPQSKKKSHSASWTGDDISSQLPSTYSLTDENSKGSRHTNEEPPSPPPLPQEPEPVLPLTALARDAPQKNTNTVDEGAARPDYIRERPEPPVQPAFIPPPVLQPFPPPAPPRSDAAAPSAEALALLRSLPLTISPPAPPTSVAPFTTHITLPLQTLTNNPDMKNRYKPQQIKRQLLTSERGHWRLDTRHWTVDLCIEFWQLSHRLVENGNFGWGVWFAREAPDDNDYSLGIVQVFCWGETVEHVYLLLYIASKNRIKRAQACWIDADGEVVVRM